MKVNNKTIVVTGAGGGIGGEVALALLARGARVAAVDLRASSLENIKQRAGDHAARLSLHPFDITSRDDVAKLPDRVRKTHGTIDGLINCAGIIQPFVKVNDLDFDAIERVMNVNFYGTVNMTKAFLPELINIDEAHIVNVSSMGGFLPVPGQSIYGASKAAVKLLSEGLYAELLTTNVKVSIVYPGATKTDITKNSKVSTPGDASAEESKFPMLSAAQAAEIILDGMERDKVHIYTGKDSKAMNRLYRLAPVRATRLIAKQMQSLLK